jgi:hypothetical protein
MEFGFTISLITFVTCLMMRIMHNEIGTWSMPHPNPGRHSGTSNSVVSSATLIGTILSQICPALLSSPSLVFVCLFAFSPELLRRLLLLLLPPLSLRVCQTLKLGTYCGFQLALDVSALK